MSINQHRIAAAQILVHTDLDFDFVKSLTKYKNPSFDYSRRGNGNKAKRRAGLVPIPFTCSCESSPCQHEFYYENSVKFWIPAEDAPQDHKLFTVDNSEPVNLDELLDINPDLSSAEIIAIKRLRVNQSLTFFNSIILKRTE